MIKGITKVLIYVRLKWLLDNWEELENHPMRNWRDCPICKGVDVTKGICCASKHISSWHEEFHPHAVKEFSNATGSHNYDYPVGDWEEYKQGRQFGKNLYKNPVRKDYAYWLKDNYEWNFNRIQKILATTIWSVFKHKESLK